MMKMYKKLYLNFWVFFKKNLVLKFLLRNYNNALIVVIYRFCSRFDEFFLIFCN